MRAFDALNPKTNEPQFLDYSLVQTVEDRKSSCSSEQMKRAEGVRKSHAKTNRPGVQHFRFALDNGHIMNCPCTGKDDEIADDIFRQDVATIRGRKLRNRQSQTPRLALVDVLEELKRIHKNVRLFIDAMFVNEIPSLHTASETLGVRTSQASPDRFKESLLMFINEIMSFYKVHTFAVQLIDTDAEFKPLEGALEVALNIVDPLEHVHPAERSIRAFKESVRCTIQGLPFSCVLKGTIVGAMIDCNRNLNRLPRKNFIA